MMPLWLLLLDLSGAERFEWPPVRQLGSNRRPMIGLPGMWRGSSYHIWEAAIYGRLPYMGGLLAGFPFEWPLTPAELPGRARSDAT